MTFITAAIIVLGFAAGFLLIRSAGRRGSIVVPGIVLIACVSAAVAVSVISNSAPEGGLHISEASCSNFNLLIDPNTEGYEDYIELHNAGKTPIRLEGYYISDSDKDRTRFRLPEIELGADEYTVLWADGTGVSGSAGEKAVSVNFSLSPGETVFLSSPNGEPIDSITMAPRYKNTSVTKRDGRTLTVFGTPGENGDAAEVYTPPTLSAPTANYPSGFYDGPINLSLSAEKGSVIRYTTDGSVPDENDPVFPAALTLYDHSPEPNITVSQPNTTTGRTGAVTDPVDKGTVIRAVAFDGNGGYSETFTAVYFVGKESFDKYKDRYVLNIVSDPDDLFGDDGIMVTGPEYDAWLEGGMIGEEPAPLYTRKGREAERDATVMLWDDERSFVMDTECGIQLQGNSSRRRDLKRFSFFARPIYGTGKLFSVQLFDGLYSHSFYTRQNVSDAIVHGLISDLELGGQEAIHAYVFLNGEFYRKSFLRERYDEQYFISHYGAKEGDTVLISGEKVDIGAEADLKDYEEMMEYVCTHDCSDPAVYAEVCRRIDVDSYSAFIATVIYFNNTDFSTRLNYRLWRSRSGSGEGALDGRWRWLIFDMDAAYWTKTEDFGDAPRASYDIFHYKTATLQETFLEMPVFGDLLKNPGFRESFAKLWLGLSNVEYSYDRAYPLLVRYGQTDDSFWPEFLRDRPKYAPDLLIGALELSGKPCGMTFRVSDPEGGSVRFNSFSTSFYGGSWSGTYVTGLPMTLAAEAADGWRFVRWEGAAESGDPDLEFTPEGDFSLTAVFERIP